MNVSPILSPSGEPVFTAGGPTAWKVAEYRGYVVSLEWARRRRKYMPMLVIWPAKNYLLAAGAVSSGMWGISRDCITQFVGFDRDDKCTGSASEHCFREALEAMPLLGKDRNDKQAFVALVDVIVKFAPELVLMPTAPRAVRQALADEAMWDVSSTNKNTGKTISEASI